jgi:hypothetical protein
MREFELPERDAPSLTVETTAPLTDQVEVVANELKRRLFE